MMNMMMLAMNISRRPSLSVSQPPSRVTDNGTSLNRSGGQPKQERWRTILLPDEYQNERNRVEIPGLHEKGGQHQDSDVVSFRCICAGKMADGTVHGRLLRDSR